MTAKGKKQRKSGTIPREVPEDIEWKSDDDFLIDGRVPEFVENCTHPDLDPKEPAAGTFVVTACEHCCQIMIPKYVAKGWEEGRGRISPLPVTIEKIANQMLRNIGTWKPER